jgi:hypothetical protein
VTVDVHAEMVSVTVAVTVTVWAAAQVVCTCGGG